jgi:hypothetical protein
MIILLGTNDSITKQADTDHTTIPYLTRLFKQTAHQGTLPWHKIKFT